MSEKFPEELLKYTESPPADEFVTGVMRRVKREQDIRTTILVISGFIGSLFGILGAMMLSEPISSLLTFQVDMSSALPGIWSVLGVVVFLFLMVSDEVNLFN